MKQRKAAASGIWQLVKATDRNVMPRQQLVSVGICTTAASGDQYIEVLTADAPPPKLVPTLVSVDEKDKFGVQAI